MESTTEQLSSAHRLDDNAYKESHDSIHSSRKTEDRHFKALNLIKYGLLRKKSGNKILNIGSGPESTCSKFAKEFLPFCDEIVFVEPNTEYCKSYKTSKWYLNNKHKIQIVNGSFEDFDKNNYSVKNQFDLIYMCQTIYFFRLKYIPLLLKKLHDLLVPNTGYCTISCASDNTPIITDVYQKVKPKYALNSYVEKQLTNFNDRNNNNNNNNNSGSSDSRLDYFSFCDNNITLLTKKEAIALFQLFIDTNLYFNDDYHNSGIINENDKLIRDKAINEALPKILKANKDTIINGKYDWFQPTIFHCFRKSNHAKQNQSKL